jgi:hypothetical protein
MSTQRSASNGHGNARALTAVRALHTALWVFFASSIVGILVAVPIGAIEAALWMSLFVWAELAVLLLNRMRCPLTIVAARYTDDRSANFDIWLPKWLARSSRPLFAVLFAISQVLLGAALFWT